jgi:putative nucleotidyltransferase with HDIG domain
MSMKRVLFVDDEPKVLDGLKRMLYPLRNEWATDFVTEGKDALRRLAEVKTDVIVTDTEMGDTTGAELLQEVSRRYPGVIRVILSGDVNQQSALPAALVSHRCLSKPCTAETLRSTLRGVVVPSFLSDDEELNRLVRSVRSLPTLPAAYIRLLAAIQASTASTGEIGEIIARDVAVSAKVLQMVNSAYFGLKRSIRTPLTAVTYLGLDAVKAIVLSLSMFADKDQYQPGPLSIQALHEHSWKVGSLARRLAVAMGLSPTDVDNAFTAGLLHDVGKLVLATHRPDLYAGVLEDASSGETAEFVAERRHFGTSHAEVGGYLLSLWGLPEATARIVAFHHRPPDAREEAGRAIAAVRIADMLAHGRSDDDDRHWIEEVGLLPTWQRIRSEFLPGDAPC